MTVIPGLMIPTAFSVGFQATMPVPRVLLVAFAPPATVLKFKEAPEPSVTVLLVMVSFSFAPLRRTLAFPPALTAKLAMTSFEMLPESFSVDVFERVTADPSGIMFVDPSDPSKFSVPPVMAVDPV